MRILIVEDEIEMAVALKRALEKQGMIADIVHTLLHARAVISDSMHDLILLDRRLPDGDGAKLVNLIKKKNADLPIIFITGRAEIYDRIEGLDLGADDYLIKPFAMEELLARIRAVIRRPSKIEIPKIDIANLTFDFATKSVEVDNIPLQLPRRQLLIFEALCMRARRTVLREWLIERAYGQDEEIQSNSLDSHISRLRRSLELAEADVTIYVIRGVGYLLKESKNAL